MVREKKLNMPTIEQFYYDEESKTYKSLVVDGAMPVIVVGGEAGSGSGGSGMRFLSGAGAPTADAGLEGDVYLNTVNGDFYRKKPTWVLEMNLKGVKGDNGNAGTNGVSVTSVVQTTTSPADAGNNVVTVTLSNGTTSTFTIKNGAKGSAGTNGTNGTNGWGTQATYDALLARVVTLEAKVADLETP